ncbi:MAG: ABC transporter substrate-binding protein [Cytophagales bacterium CG12_big_fil_rev_8_21_14_0_65_40_12]|nr:MAG: ABC transporter substrate-binding protein [Cytophagales bacterium CG12_big_fil_rev_8_21_14_0_65_40_12]PIW04944.1 MAG: ABC transporter substrate-binding protein [Cytophagales bacterium CG17_big_fil_post_rev_8_21_14_2_50_40_13]
MTKLKIGGVPEHFNMPWQLLLRSGQLSEIGINAAWTDFQGGTGAMGHALHDGDLDIAVLLTEGAIQGIDKGKDYKVISFYVDSPLNWGIHVPGGAAIEKTEELEGKRYAISRYGSGSHLMAMIDAKERSWDYGNLNFIEVDSLQGARDSFQKSESEIFFWEKYTTKSLVDSGEFRRIAERKTPFSCFVICASDRALKEKSNAIKATIELLFSQVRQLNESAQKASIISDFYKLSKTDVENWLIDLRWANQPHLNKEELEKVVSILFNLQLIRAVDLNQICSEILY